MKDIKSKDSQSKDFRPKDFEEVLYSIKDQVSNLLEFDEVSSIGGNLNTRGVSYKSRKNPHGTGTIIVGEDKDSIAVDISILDGAVRSFVLADEEDRGGINNVVSWFKENYS